MGDPRDRSTQDREEGVFSAPTLPSAAGIYTQSEDPFAGASGVPVGDLLAPGTGDAAPAVLDTQGGRVRAPRISDLEYLAANNVAVEGDATGAGGGVGVDLGVGLGLGAEGFAGLLNQGGTCYLNRCVHGCAQAAPRQAVVPARVQTEGTHTWLCALSWCIVSTTFALSGKVHRMRCIS